MEVSGQYIPKDRTARKHRSDNLKSYKSGVISKRDRSDSSTHVCGYIWEINLDQNKDIPEDLPPLPRGLYIRDKCTCFPPGRRMGGLQSRHEAVCCNSVGADVTCPNARDPKFRVTKRLTFMWLLDKSIKECYTFSLFCSGASPSLCNLKHGISWSRL
jgi:hypothetical protein